MRRTSVGGLLIRGMLAASFLAAGCNGLLGNEERTFVDDTNGTESGSGGMDSTTKSGGTTSSDGGLGGASAESGGAAGAGVEDGGEAGESGGTGGPGSSGGASTSGAAGGSGGTGGTGGSGGSGGSSSTGEPCECTPGLSEPLHEPCGKCGTTTRSRLCNEDCQWGEYGELGACMNEGVCVPNADLQETGHCANGGWRFDTATCGADCQPGTWTRGECDYGQNSCTGCACMAECEPAARCFWIDCAEDVARDECLDDSVTVCGTTSFEFVEWLPN